MPMNAFLLLFSVLVVVAAVAPAVDVAVNGRQFKSVCIFKANANVIF